MRTIPAEMLTAIRTGKITPFLLLDMNIDGTHYRYTDCDVPIVLYPPLKQSQIAFGQGLRFSLADGYAFLDVGESGFFDDYIGEYLTIKDVTGDNEISGWIKALVSNSEIATGTLEEDSYYKVTAEGEADHFPTDKSGQSVVFDGEVGAVTMTVAGDSSYEEDIYDFSFSIDFALDKWLPTGGGVHYLYFRRTPTAGGYTGIAIIITASGLLRFGMYRDAALEYFGSSDVSAFTDGSRHRITFVVRRETAAAAGSVEYWHDKTKNNTSAISAEATVSMVTGSNSYYDYMNVYAEKRTIYNINQYNYALTQSQIEDLCDNGVAEADQWGNQADLITATMINLAGYPYDTLDGASATGFHAVDDGASTVVAVPTNSISWVSGKKYRVDFDLTLTSGTAPFYVPTIAAGSSILGGAAQQLAVSGHNSYEFTATESRATGSFSFYNFSTSTEYTISNLIIRQIGATVSLSPEGMRNNVAGLAWYDDSDNNNDVTFSDEDYADIEGSDLYFTSDGTDTCDANNKVILQSETLGSEIATGTLTEGALYKVTAEGEADKFSTDKSISSVATTQQIGTSQAMIVAYNDVMNPHYGDFSWSFKSALADWTPTVDVRFMARYANSTNQHSVLKEASSGKLWLYLDDTSCDVINAKTTTAPTLVDGQEYRITIVLNRATAAVAGSVDFYIDKTLFESVAIAAGTGADQDYSIGSVLELFGRDTSQYEGTSKEFQMFSYALTSAMVEDLVDNGVAAVDKWGDRTTLITSAFINLPTHPYDTLDGTSVSGFHAVDDGATTVVVTPGNTIAWVSGYRYRIDFDFTLTSGTAPSYVPTIAAGSSILNGTSSQLAVDGHNSYEFVPTASFASGSLSIYNLATATEYTVSNLIVTRLGAVLDLEPEGIRLDQWYDESDNDNDVTYPVEDSSSSDVAITVSIDRFFNSDGTETCDANNKVRQVTAPGVTGVTIVTTEDGTTYNWESIDSGFDVEDAAGFDLQIFNDDAEIERYEPRRLKTDDIHYGTDKIVDNFDFSIDNMDDALSIAFLGGTPQGGEVILKQILLSDGYTFVAAPVIWFQGDIDEWNYSEGSLLVSVTSEFVRWQHRTLSKHPATCRWKEFKGTECQYSGGADWCDRTYERCKALNNTVNFGGFRFLPSIIDKEIWWGTNREL